MVKITRIIKGELVEIDDTDRTWQQGNPSSAEYYRREQKTKFRKELVQRVQPREFIQAYGAEAARERGISESEIRKYS